MYLKDTIAAIATPVGLGGIGIIKISGPQALQAVSHIFRSPAFTSAAQHTHHLLYGTIIDPRDDRIVDEVLVSYMKAPSSYTREDVVEINGHSGLLVLQRILDLVLQEGVRLAEPGEFTKRAFLNGRIDLTQAEAVIDIIEAKTEASLKLASQQLRGRLAQKLSALHTGLIEMSSHLEASIDFPEEDIEFQTYPAIKAALNTTIAEIKHLIETYEEGKLYRLGVKTIIVGKPNVGKSSLLNALLGETRALVTPVPGTTRDFIQETINIRGIPVIIQDTAGLHDGEGEIEKLGIELTRDKLSEAELVLLVVDGSQQIDGRDRAIIEEIQSRRVITIINKADLPLQITEQDVHRILPFDRIIFISALHHNGLKELKELIYTTLLQSPHDVAADILITNTRQKTCLDRTVEHLLSAMNGIDNNVSPELIAVDFQAALSALGEITGKTTTDDILDRIFSTFCIGK
jgi:tRNA modification GTPase